MSIEEKVEEYYKNKLKELNIRYYGRRKNNKFNLQSIARYARR